MFSQKKAEFLKRFPLFVRLNVRLTKVRWLIIQPADWVKTWLQPRPVFQSNIVIVRSSIISFTIIIVSLPSNSFCHFLNAWMPAECLHHCGRILKSFSLWATPIVGVTADVSDMDFPNNPPAFSKVVISLQKNYVSNVHFVLTQRKRVTAW